MRNKLTFVHCQVKVLDHTIWYEKYECIKWLCSKLKSLAVDDEHGCPSVTVVMVTFGLTKMRKLQINLTEIVMYHSRMLNKS